MTHARYPLNICFLTPVANKLENRAGTIARVPLTSVRLTAFTVPNVSGEGDMSLMASWQAAVFVQVDPV